jgi:hypothetical protein
MRSNNKNDYSLIERKAGTNIFSGKSYDKTAISSY